jgi:hypothetical protein
MTPEQFLSQIKPLLPGLHSVVLYGSSAAGDFVQGASRYDLMLVAERWGLVELQAIAAADRTWQQAGNAPPQLFTVAELSAAADVFPIEILDLQQSRRVLLGSDPIAELQVDLAQLRLQLEHELRSKLLMLRQRLLAATGDERRLSRVLLASLSSFLVLFRASLRLYDNEVPPQKRAALLALARHIDFDTQPFLTLLESKERAEKPGASAAAVAGAYLAAIEQVIGAVDRHITQARNKT